MKTLLGGIVSDARGSLGGQTFSRNKGGNYIRRRVSPIQPQTTFQLDQRERVASTSDRWANALSTSQRSAWENFAVQFPIVDTLGQTIQLSGQQAYVKINTRLLAGGKAVIDDAPANQDVPALDVTSLTIDTTMSAYDIGFDNSVFTGADSLQLEATPGISPGITFVKDIKRLILTTGPTPSDPTVFTTEWLVRFGSLATIGTKMVVFARIIRDTNGAVSVPVRTDAIVI